MCHRSLSTSSGDTANVITSEAERSKPNDTLVSSMGEQARTGDRGVEGPFQGGAGEDLSLIPLLAIDHVEVLTDAPPLNMDGCNCRRHHIILKHDIMAAL